MNIPGELPPTSTEPPYPYDTRAQLDGFVRSLHLTAGEAARLLFDQDSEDDLQAANNMLAIARQGTRGQLDLGLVPDGARLTLSLAGDHPDKHKPTKEKDPTIDCQSQQEITLAKELGDYVRKGTASRVLLRYKNAIGRSVTRVQRDSVEYEEDNQPVVIGGVVNATFDIHGPKTGELGLWQAVPHMRKLGKLAMANAPSNLLERKIDLLDVHRQGYSKIMAAVLDYNDERLIVFGEPFNLRTT